MTSYKRTKRDELLKIDKLSDELWISKDHELNKERLRTIISIANSLLVAEDLAASCEKSDVSMKKALKAYFEQMSSCDKGV